MLLWALLVCTAGCDVVDPQPAVEETRGEIAKQGMEDRSLLEPGAAVVEFSDQLLTVRSNRARRLAIVKRVAEAAGFDLVAGRVEPKLLTVRIERTPLEEALPSLLGDLPYAVEYVFDPKQRVHVVAELRVGEPETPAVAAAPPEAKRSSEKTIAASASASPPPRTDDPSVEDLRYQIEDLALEQEEAFDRTVDASSQVRADVISEMHVTGEGLDVILDALALDSDPEVRAAAARRLASAEGFAATAGLLEALNDSAPEVALQAIDSLVAIGDRTVVWNLKETAEQTSNPQTQRALRDAIQTLQASVGMVADGEAGGSGTASASDPQPSSGFSPGAGAPGAGEMGAPTPGFDAGAGANAEGLPES
jgi:hypothetical protein